MSIADLPPDQQRSIRKLSSNLDTIIKHFITVHEGMQYDDQIIGKMLGIVLWNQFVDFIAITHNIEDKNRLEYLHNKLDNYMQELIRDIKNAPSNN